MRSRREFLQMCAAMAGASSLEAQTGNYRALVCVFLFGGNDGNNMIVPMETSAYAAYQRGRGPLALAQRDLAAVTAQGKAYGFHPRLSGLRDLYQQRRVAVLANTGMLVRPVTRAQYLSPGASVPRNLYSHSDQVQQWQSSNPTGASPTGWAGRIADSLPTGDAPIPPVISVSGNSLFLTGLRNTPANLSPGNDFGIAYSGDGKADQARLEALQQILNLDSGAKLVSAAQGVLASGMKNSQELRRALSGAPAVKTEFPDTDLGRQLKQVAQLIASRTRLGASRQIFFCSQGGFDNHTDLLPSQDSLFAVLGPALVAFYRATEELGVASQVTSFTASEFGRTFNSSSTNGSDHAWGNHHLIMGAGVRGGEMYGEFPVQELRGANDAGDRGVWIPTTSLDQYGAALAGWFGVGAGDMRQVFPNLANFATPPALL
ncbi:MAG: DUF1501 domain-containing protein [Bryobacteraceae bacterium]